MEKILNLLNDELFNHQLELYTERMKKLKK